jgi:acyl-homoserine lactone acylase PvdQ
LLLLLPCTQVFATECPDTSTRRLDVGAPAQIIRDTDGVSHTFATTECDLLFLQGYAQARDHLFQVDTLRRQAHGTLAEHSGKRNAPFIPLFRTDTNLSQGCSNRLAKFAA